MRSFEPLNEQMSHMAAQHFIQNHHIEIMSHVLIGCSFQIPGRDMFQNCIQSYASRKGHHHKAANQTASHMLGGQID